MTYSFLYASTLQAVSLPASLSFITNVSLSAHFIIQLAKFKFRSGLEKKNRTACFYNAIRSIPFAIPTRNSNISTILTIFIVLAWFKANIAVQMRSSVFWDVKQRVLVLSYLNFGKPIS